MGLSQRVYRTKPANIEEFKQRIRDEITAIEQDMIERAVSSFYDRMAFCQEVDGNHFEHKL